MRELLLISGIAGLVLLLCGGLLGWGVLKKRKDFQRGAFALLICGLGLVGWVGLRLATKSYHKLSEAARPRTGDEIYEALFGQKLTGCVQVLNYQDQVIPKIDYAIWLQVETCPQEVKRMLRLHRFTRRGQATAGWQISGPAARNSWFKPESMGDTILVFAYKRGAYGSEQTLYVSADSTRMFCVDYSE